MPPHARLAVPVVALAMILGLPASSPAPDSPDPSDTSDDPSAPAASVARPIPGESFTLSGSLGSSVRRVVQLQTVHDGAWRTVQQRPVEASGDYSFTLTQTSWRASWRLLADGVSRDGRHWERRVTATRTLFAQQQSATTSLARSVRAGARVQVTLFAAPARPGRVLTLQRDTGTGWKRVADLTADETGHATYAFKTRTAGKTRFRTVAREHHGAPVLAGPAAAVYALSGRQVGVMAWRGDSRNHPENTLDAFRGAVRQRADFIEMDFQPTADGEWVLLHDTDLTRTTDVETRFPERRDAGPRAFTLAELKQLDAGSWMGPQFRGTRIPTIEETFDAIDAAEATFGHEVRLVVELKGESAAEMRALYRKVVSLRPTWVSRKGHRDKAIFMSFDPGHFDFPGVEATGMERVAVKDEPDPADRYGPGYYQVHLRTSLLSTELVERTRQHGASIGTWPAVGTASVLRAAVLGVDFVTTDDVAEAREALLR